jgi:hypothetical protein
MFVSEGCKSSLSSFLCTPGVIICLGRVGEGFLGAVTYVLLLIHAGFIITSADFLLFYLADPVLNSLFQVAGTEK